MTDSTMNHDSLLAESEARYAAVIENASDMIQSIRPDGTFEFVNKAWKDKLGYSDEEVESLIIWDIIDADALSHCMPAFQQVMTGVAVPTMTTTFVTKDGRLIPSEGSATPRIVDGEVVATHAFFRDISEQLRTRELEEKNAALEREKQARFLEKMAALGKLAAGLSHELNNPAAAAQRASTGLQESLVRRDQALNSMVNQGLTPDQCAQLNQMRQQMIDTDSSAISLSAMAISAREDELETWLDQNGIPEPWNLAPLLARTDLTEPELDSMISILPPALATAAMNWIAESVAVRDFTTVISRSSRRISELVTAVKSYSYMDQATEQMVDIHDGLQNTLIILAHPLRDVTVLRDFCDSLPLIPAHGSGLNQVWTNLLDNSADAAGVGGTIQIHTRQEDDQVVIEIEDNGQGIPEEIRSRIFEPFFTTKSQGDGTGLGLDIVWRIIVDEHHGTIEVESEPGRTLFRVCLPTGRPAAEG